jgi:hypothetical protein
MLAPSVWLSRVSTRSCLSIARPLVRQPSPASWRRRLATAQIMSTHYASEERIAALLERLGKNASAQCIREKLPQGPRIRSGDLGEILATEFIAEQSVYTVPIKRLRWKDHRNMAMRGDDVIAVRIPEEGPPLEFLKSETKSRAQLAAGVASQASHSWPRSLNSRNTFSHSAWISWRTCHQAVLPHLRFSSATHRTRWPKDRNRSCRHQTSLRSQPVFGFPWKTCLTEDRARAT